MKRAAERGGAETAAEVTLRHCLSPLNVFGVTIVGHPRPVGA